MRSLTVRTKAVLLLLSALLLLSLLLHSFLTGYEQRLSAARDLLGAWNLPEAEDYLRSIVTDFPDSLDARRMYADCLLKRGELGQARREYSILVATDSAHLLPNTLSLALAMYFLGNLDSSASLTEGALAKALERKNSGAIAQCYHIMGRIGFNRASYDSALVLQRRSLEWARASGSLQGEADALRQIGVLYWYSGKTDSACSAFYEPSLALYRQIGDRIGEATTLNNIGLAVGNVKYCLEAFAIRKRIGDQVGLADSYYFVTAPVGGGHWNDLAYSFRVKSLRLSMAIGYEWGREVAARAVDQMAFSIHDSLSFDRVHADTTNTSGEGLILRLQVLSTRHMRNKEWSNAESLRKRIVFLCDSMQYKPGLGMALAQYSDVLLKLGKYDEAERTVARLATVWANEPLNVDAALAQIYRAAGRHKEAARLLTAMVQQYDALYRDRLHQNVQTFSISAGHSLYHRFALFEMLINSLSNLNDERAAFQAFELFRSVPFAFIPGGAGNDSVNGRGQLWQQYNKTLEAIDREQSNADLLVEDFLGEYTEAEKELAAFPNVSSNLTEEPIPQLIDVQRAMRSREVIVEYFLGTEHAYIFAISSERSSFAKISTPVSNLNSSARIFGELVLRGKESPMDTLWRKPALFLFSALLQPLLATNLLNDGDHLMIAPHGVLHGVPFAALLDTTGRYAVDRFTIHYLPRASIVTTEERNPDRSGAVAFVPDRTTLRFAEKEAGSIPPSLFGHRTIFADDEATVAEFLRKSPSASLVHIAAHGTMNKWQPLYSRLQMSDGALELHTILTTPLAAQLVVVGACETGSSVGMLGDVSYGHSVVSFPYAFLAAGASSVLSPLWIVEDESASRLLQLFYFSLERSATPDGQLPRGTASFALAEAQRQFIRDAGKAGREHPFYWAAFSLTGSPR